MHPALPWPDSCLDSSQCSDLALLDDTERAFADLVASPDLLVDGGVHEFFGWDDPRNAEAHAAARAGSGGDGRNEGCSLADLVRLALQLHRLTGKASYLDAAESCWLNALSHNQFASGDYGHHTYFDQGMKPVANLARSWWCCTMHGYRAFPDVLEAGDDSLDTRPRDTDDWGAPDHRDTDSDNDGLSDAQEAAVGSDSRLTDTTHSTGRFHTLDKLSASWKKPMFVAPSPNMQIVTPSFA